MGSATGAPRGMRLHIGIFGRRNVGKSSLLNAITRQQVSIVSEIAGTTTDPVEKPMEMLPLGPVLFIDTAGIDDEGALGEKRVSRTLAVFDRTDIGVLVSAAGHWGDFEEGVLSTLRDRQLPVIVVFNKMDLATPDEALMTRLRAEKVPIVTTVAAAGQGAEEVRRALLTAAPADFVNNPSILGDLVRAGDHVVLVIPIDKEAPRGRIILPQVQTIRDLLDHDAWSIVVKDNQLRDCLDRLKTPPRLVVTDSQAFAKVAADTPQGVWMTGFSILFARFKGDLAAMVESTHAVDRLRPGDPVLISEACSHHPITEDIGRVKIPAWLNGYVGGELAFDFTQGHDFPADLERYKLVVHCGSCMLNRREVLTRQLRCHEAGVPMTNYGLTIAYSLGIFDRALQPFPDALAAHRRAAGDFVSRAAGRAPDGPGSGLPGSRPEPLQ